MFEFDIDSNVGFIKIGPVYFSWTNTVFTPDFWNSGIIYRTFGCCDFGLYAE